MAKQRLPAPDQRPYEESKTSRMSRMFFLLAVYLVVHYYIDLQGCNGVSVLCMSMLGSEIMARVRNAPRHVSVK